MTIGVEFGSRVVPVGPPASNSLDIDRDNTTGRSSQLQASPNGAPEKNGSTQKKMKLSLWDTAGQETYKSVTRSYFRGASGALLVFDITRPSTFASVAGWLQDLRLIAEEGIVVVLVGNKSDLAGDEKSAEGQEEGGQTKNQRRVTRQEAEEWCRQNNVIRYIETSAKSGEGVERAFLEVAERIYRNIEAGRYDLNDRRSGVKGYGASNGGMSTMPPRTITLGLNDAMDRGGKGWSGACC